MKLETEPLILREMTEEDLPGLSLILRDKEVMYAYEHAFSPEEVCKWMDRQLARYREYGHRFGLWAAVLKATGGMIGQCGLTLQEYRGGQVPEIGYLFRKEFGHRGYATEAARACKRYAFGTLNYDEVFSIIRDMNIASQRVALRNGMSVKDRIVKHYYHMDMLHLVFSVKRD